MSPRDKTPNIREVDPSSFGGQLRRLRMDAGLTQEELGEAIGLNQQRISMYERGLHLPEREEVIIDLASTRRHHGSISTKPMVSMRPVQAAAKLKPPTPLKVSNIVHVRLIPTPADGPHATSPGRPGSGTPASLPRPAAPAPRHPLRLQPGAIPPLGTALARMAGAPALDQHWVAQHLRGHHANTITDCMSLRAAISQ